MCVCVCLRFENSWVLNFSVCWLAYHRFGKFDDFTNHPKKFHLLFFLISFRFRLNGSTGENFFPPRERVRERERGNVCKRFNHQKLLIPISVRNVVRCEQARRRESENIGISNTFSIQYSVHTN